MLLFIGHLQLLPQAASWAAQSEQDLLRPLTSSVLPWSWVAALALVWGCVTPVSTSRGDQPLVLGGPITGAAHEVVWADGGRCRGHGKLITRKRLQSSHGGVSQVRKVSSTKAAPSGAKRARRS